MNPLAALLLATPVWGFSLTPPVLAAPDLDLDTAAQVRTVVAETEVTMSSPADIAAEARNNHIMNWNRALQVSTTLAMAVTGALGFVQFHDEYGFHDEYSETNCGRGQGDPVFAYCGESTPVPHLIGAATSAVGLISSVAVSTQVDFDRAARRDSDWRIYETTRWVALGLGLAQAVGGALLANAQRAGVLSYEDDFDLMQGVAVAHMALGAANVGMNLANSILLF